MAENNDLVFKSATQLAGLIRRKEISPVEVTSAFLKRIEALNPKLNAFITVTADHAIARAREAEAQIRKGRYIGPLHGLPYAAKDCIATKGILTTNGSKVYEGWMPDSESAVTAKLNAAGAILLGKLNLWELASAGFAMGVVRNPWSLQHAPGGSSGGSGAAVAARMTPLALGTDTGGSIRMPAALCGIVGLRPTYGRISLRGIIVNTWTVDTVGPMAANVEDTAAMTQVLAGVESGAFSKSLAKFRIGVPRSYFFEVAPEIEESVRSAIAVLVGLGATTVEVDVPHASYANVVRDTLFAESACYHERRLRTKAHLMGAAARERLEVATFTTATDYIKAQRIRSILCREADELFTKCDVFVTPTLQNTASLLSAGLTISNESTRPMNAGNMTFSSVTGVPALAVPCGFSKRQPALPISMLLHARAFNERALLQAGYAYQSATDWHTRVPSL